MNSPLSAPQSPCRAQILLVVADDALRGLVGQTLQRTGYDTVDCSDFRSAVAWLDQGRPDLLLVDDVLGDIPWERFAGELRDGPPCILLTSHGNEPQAMQLVGNGARDYLVKGLELLARLPAVVRQNLARVSDERNLADAQRLLRLTRFAVDHAAEAIFTVSPEGHVLDANATASQWLEYSREELRGMSLSDLTDGSLALDWPALWAALTRDGRAVGETVCRNRSGRCIPVELLAAYLHFEGDEYCCISARDITERKAAAARLAEHQALLEQMVEVRTRELARTHERLRQSERLASLGTLAAGFAHEINNPLGAIRLSVENALEGLDRPEDAKLVRKLMGDVVSYTERCKQIVVSLMRLAWQEPPRLGRGAVNDIVRRAVERAGRYALACGARIDMQLADDLPTVDLAEGEMVQVINSLLENACESRPRGAVVQVRTQVDVAQVTIEVEDNGRGMSVAEQQRIFEPFFTTKKEQGGVGLGLTVALAMVVASRGRLDFKSVPGKGSVFLISFPHHGEAP